jgi:hypothetical protein
VHLIGRKKLNYRGAVTTIIGLPLAILFAWVAQATAGGDNVRVNSSNQQGGITANTVNINAPPGALQSVPSNKAFVMPDKELLAITLQSQSDALQQYQAMYARCKTPSPEFLDWCKTVRSAIATQTATFNKMCRDNEVPRGQYGCP